MTNSQSRVSAEIIQFPARGRFAVGAQRHEAKQGATMMPRIARVALGSAWYHDEAIQEAERTTEH